MTVTSKAACAANSALQPCVCYDTCPTGPTYYPWFDDWSVADPKLYYNSTETPIAGGAQVTNKTKTYVLNRAAYVAANTIMMPCSGKGACRHTGECHCQQGYSGPNCGIHITD